VAAAHGHQGHPVLWARSFFREIAGLTGDKGARELLDAHAAMVTQVETGDDAPLTDIDTQEALAAFRS
jgi:molybdenum cofactor cytidylyltransferase